MEPLRQRAILAALPYLVSFAQTGQVSLAAAVLGVPQPTVSRGLARLNELVGVPLTVREGRGLRLTRDGESFVRHAESAVGTVTAALAELDGRGTGADEEISIAYLNTLGSTTVPVLLRAFLAERPRTRVALWVGSRGQCLTRLENKQREVVSLAYLRDLSHGELAEQLKLPLGTVKTWIRRGLEQLRACMARYA